MFKRFYFENFILCGNCNGTGLRDYMDYCRVCDATGIEKFWQFVENHKRTDLITLHLQYSESLKQLKP